MWIIFEVICYFSVSLDVYECSHIRAINIYADSILEPFEAMRCESLKEARNKNCVAVGYELFDGEGFNKRAKEGFYYFTTHYAQKF